MWPYGCTIVNVIKVDDEGNKVDTTDKAGDRVIRAGQTYTVKAFVYDELKAIEEMEYLTKNYSVRETTELLKRKGFGGILLRRKAKTNKKESDGANGAVDSAFDAERKNFETQEMPADNKEIREQVDNDEKVDSDKQ